MVSGYANLPRELFVELVENNNITDRIVKAPLLGRKFLDVVRLGKPVVAKLNINGYVATIYGSTVLPDQVVFTSAGLTLFIFYVDDDTVHLNPR